MSCKVTTSKNKRNSFKDQWNDSTCLKIVNQHHTYSRQLFVLTKSVKNTSYDFCSFYQSRGSDNSWNILITNNEQEKSLGTCLLIARIPQPCLAIQWILLVVPNQLNQTLELCGTDREEPSFSFDKAVLDFSTSAIKRMTVCTRLTPFDSFNIMHLLKHA